MSHILRPRSHNVYRIALLLLTVGALCWSLARRPYSPNRQGASAKDAVALAPNPTDRAALEPTLWGGTFARSAAPSASDEPTRARVGAAYGKLPLSFEANRGQFDGRVRYFARGGGYNLFLTRTEAVLALRGAGAADKSASTGGRSDEEARTAKPSQAVVRMKLRGANPEPSITAVDELPGKSNYLIGDDPAKWRTGVSHYARVRYENVYPGVSLIYFGNQRRLEYDFVVAPGANPGVIKLVFGGARDLHVDEGGDLILRTEGGGELRQHKPLIYQEVDGERKEVAGGYVLRGGREVGFEVAGYDAGRPLVIDPVVSYSTYLGGAGADTAYDIAVDSSGNAYVTGATKSANFPVANSLPHGDRDGLSEDVFVTKLNAAGSALVYSTYLGGAGDNREDRARAIAVDATGAAYVAGYTGSSSFPTVNALQPALRGFYDAFVAKLNPSGSALVYSTFLGGSDSNEEIRGIAVDSSGGAYVTGYTRSTDFPLANALRATHGGGSDDGFVAKLSPSGSALVYSTYLGGHSFDNGNSVAVDSAGSAYVTGLTYSSNFPLANPLQPTCGCSLGTCAGDGDIFITKLNPAGSALVYSTFLGGHGVEEGRDIAVDSSGSAYVTGSTGSGNFPTVNPFQPTLSSGSAFCNSSDAFVTKLNPSGSALVYSTFLGGFQGDGGNSIAVDSAGSAYVTGSTLAPNFPVADASQPTIGGAADVFVTKLSPGGSALVFSTYLGGGGADVGNGIGLDPAGNAYVTGYTQGAFPTEKPFQPVFGGGNFNTNESLDAFVAKVGDTRLQPAALSVSAVTPNKGGNIGTVSVTVHGGGFASGATVKLARAGQPDVSAMSVAVSEDGTVARARFNLVEQSAGVRDVVLTNPGGASVNLAEGFTVEEGGRPHIWVDIIGRGEFRAGRPQTYFIAFGNRGSVDASYVPLSFAVPKAAEYELGFDLFEPPQPVAGETFDFAQIPTHYETATEKIIPLFVPVIPAGSSDFIKIRVTGGDQPLRLVARVIQFPQMLFAASAPKAAAGDGAAARASGDGPLLCYSGQGGCLSTIVAETMNCGLGFVPGDEPVTCPTARAQYQDDLACNAITTTADAAREGGFTESGLLVSGIHATVGAVKVGAACAGASPGVGTVIAAVNCGFGENAIEEACPGFGPFTWVAEKITIPLFSRDPNDKFGPAGSGAGRHLSGEEPLRYSISFENVESANAPAQDVVITDQLDPAELDFDTFSFGPVAFGANQQFVPPQGLSEFKKDLDLRPANNLLVRVEAKLDKATGLLTWRFTSLDPATGLPTEDPAAGFLPPNKTSPEGEGQVLFTVRPKEGAETGAEIRNRARIVFDTNAPIDTPEWLNTIDNSRPTSAVTQLAAAQSSLSFNVNWAGADTGSGIRDYSVYVSQNGGPYTVWLSGTAATSGVFTGVAGATYSFFSLAGDKVGNVEQDKHAAEATTVVRLHSSVTNVSGNGSYNGAATLTATLTAGGSPLSGQTVSFTLKGAAVGSATTDAAGVARLADVSLSGVNAGTHPGAVGARFAGGAGFTDATGAGSLNVGKANQTISFAPPPAKNFGDPDFDVSATATSGLPVSLSSTGNCTVTVGAVHLTGAGSCTVTASQSGDSNFNAAPDVRRTFQIAKAPTTTTIISSANPSAAGQSVNFTAKVASAAGAPTGSVQFKVDGASLGAPVALGPGGAAVAASAPLASGFHAVTAVYSGDDNFAAGSGALSGGQWALTFSVTLNFKGEGHEGETEMDFHVSLSPATTLPVTVGYATADGTASAPSDYAAASGALFFPPGQTSKTVAVKIKGDTTYEETEDFFVEVTGPTNARVARGRGLILNDDPTGGVIEFEQPTYSVAEGGSLTVKVVRTLWTNLPVAVNYTTDDGSTPSVFVPCSATTGRASDRCDYTKALGTLHFAPGETEKTFKVLAGDDSYVEGAETLRLRLTHPAGNAAIGPKSAAVVTVNDDSPETAGNPIDETNNFVKQQYLDFLSREPDADGLQFWTGGITGCGSDAGCREVKRIDTSAAFFLSIEFQETGYFVYRVFRAAYGDATSPNVAGTVPAVRLNEFLPDTQLIGQGVVVRVGDWERRLEANKEAYVLNFVQRPRFLAAFPASMTAEEFVSKLALNVGGILTAEEKARLVSTLGPTPGDAAKRASALRQVAEHALLKQLEFNRAFVLMQFYGYLRRNPDDAPDADFRGWKFWLDKLEQFDGDYRRAEMVKAFLNAEEYRKRFGQ